MPTIPLPPRAGKAPFPQGTLIATPNALMALDEAGVTSGVLFEGGNRNHWREREEDDENALRMAPFTGLRRYYNYTLPNGVELLLVTEPDRTVSILQLAGEY